jgi:hypothetical protein
VHGCALADGLPQLRQGPSEAHELGAQLLHGGQVVGSIIGLLLRVCGRDVLPDGRLEVHGFRLLAVHCQQHGRLAHVRNTSLVGVAWIFDERE